MGIFIGVIIFGNLGGFLAMLMAAPFLSHSTSK
jgi:hypothetical protein